MSRSDKSTQDYAVLLLRLLLGALFIAHLYWKFVIRPDGIEGWWGGLSKAGYPTICIAYVFSVECLGALLLIPGILTRYVALYAMPMMFGAAWFWAVRKGFYFTDAGCEMPLTWTILLGLQVMFGDGPYALVKSPDLGVLLSRLMGRRAAGQTA